MRPQPLIAVRDVEASSRWYQRLLDCKSAHGGPDYERLVKDGELILQLHSWNHGSDDHPNLEDPDRAPHGYGVLLWFETDAFEAAVKRVRAVKAEIVEEPHLNPAANHREVWIRDPDGYLVVLASPEGDTGRRSRK
jgi:catechol 2,3-dioxygenase-like lactoylglutathione lyase family enzyme